MSMLLLSQEVIERAAEKPPPILQMPVEAHESRLRKFIALQDEPILILGPRRIPPLPCATANTHYAISIVTSVGFSTLESTQYAEAAQELKPDIVFGMADVVDTRPGVKRLEKMGDRTQSWLRDLVAAVKADEGRKSDISLFASILPIEAEQQSYYLEALEEEFSEDISGLVLHDTSSVSCIPKSLSHLPRVLTANSPSPHKLLDAIAVGVDVFTVPFVGAATDAGIALDFSFPSLKPDNSGTLLPLGLDMWSAAYAVDTTPLRDGCDCYTCSNHHKAYLQHLFSAKEMLGWTLLQIHNHRVMDNFFAGVRHTIKQDTFDKGVEVFARTYESELPEKTGQGPRYFPYMYSRPMTWCLHFTESGVTSINRKGKGSLVSILHLTVLSMTEKINLQKLFYLVLILALTILKSRGSPKRPIDSDEG